MRLLRENMEVEIPAGGGETQTRVEGALMLPGNERDVAILLSTARLELGNAEVQTDRIAVEGTVYFTVLYVDKEGAVQSIEAASPFTSVLDTPGATSRMRPTVSGQVESVAAEEAGGRVSLYADVRLQAEAVESMALPAVTAIEEAGELATLPSEVGAVVLSGEGRQRLLQSESFPLERSDTRVLFSSARAEIQDTQAGERGVTVTGQVHVSTALTAGAETPYYTVNESIPFTVTVDIEESRHGMQAQSEASVQELVVEAIAGEEGTGTLRVEYILQVDAQVYRRQESQLIKDAYPLSDMGFTLQQETARICCGLTWEEQKQPFKAVVELTPQNKPIAAIWGVHVQPMAISFSGENSSLAEGVAEVTLIYGASGQAAPEAVRQEIPFSLEFDLPPEDTHKILTMSDCAATVLSSDKAEVRCSMTLTALRRELCQVQYVSDAQEEEEAVALPAGVTLYYPSAQEDAWAVAKRFRIAKEELGRLNPDGGSPVVVYRQLTEF